MAWKYCLTQRPSGRGTGHRSGRQYAYLHVLGIQHLIIRSIPKPQAVLTDHPKCATPDPIFLKQETHPEL